MEYLAHAITRQIYPIKTFGKFPRQSEAHHSIDLKAITLPQLMLAAITGVGS